MNQLRVILSKMSIKGGAVASYNGTSLDIHPYGSLSDDEPIHLDSSIPVSSLLEIHISAYLARIADQYDFLLDDAVSKLMKSMRIKEQKTSFRFLQLDHLLNHTSGLSNLRSKRDVIHGKEIVSVKDPGYVIPLHHYLSQSVTQIQSPGIVVVQNPIDYAIVARITEHITETSFSEGLTGYLSSHQITHSPFDDKFPMGNIRFGRKYKKSKAKPREYFHLYPSTMGRLTIREVLTSVHSLLFTSSEAERNRQILLKERHTPYRYADSTCLPFRYRHMVDVYQMTASGQGYSLNLVVHLPTQTVGLAMINQESPNSEYITGKILRTYLSKIGISGFQDYPEETLEMTEANKELLVGRYKTYRNSILSNQHNFRLGGGLQIKEKKNRLYVTNVPDGYYSQSTKMSYRHHLRPILQDEDRLVLAFDDGLHVSKLVVPSISKASSIYSEIDSGSTLFLKSFQSNVALINLKYNLDYMLYSKIIPRLNSSSRGLWGLITRKERPLPVYKTPVYKKPLPISVPAPTGKEELLDAFDDITTEAISVQNTSSASTKDQMADLLADMDMEPLIEPIPEEAVIPEEAAITPIGETTELSEGDDESLEIEEKVPIKRKRVSKKAQEPNKLVGYFQVCLKHLLLTPLYLLIVLKGILFALPAFSRPFVSRFIPDMINFLSFITVKFIALLSLVFWTLIHGSARFINFVGPYFRKGGQTLDLYATKVEERLDFFGKPKAKRYGFRNHLRYYIRTGNKDTLRYLYAKHPQMTRTMIRKQQSSLRIYTSRKDKIRKYNQHFPQHLSFSSKGLNNLEAFFIYHVKKLRLRTRLPPRMYAKLEEIKDSLSMYRRKISIYHRYSTLHLRRKQRLKKKERAMREGSVNELVLNSNLSQYIPILLEHGIMSNKKLSQTSLRDLIAIPGINQDTAKLLLNH